MLLAGRDRHRADLLDRVRAERSRCGSCRGSASRRRARSTRSSSSRDAARARAHRRRHARERHVGRARRGAAARRPRSVPLEARRGGREAADRRRRAEERVRGPDAALRPRPAVARADGAPDGLRRSGPRRSRSSTGCSELQDALVRLGSPSRARSRSALRTRRASATATRRASSARYFEKLRYSFGPRERAGFYNLPRDGTRRRRARSGARAAVPPGTRSRSPDPHAAPDATRSSRSPIKPTHRNHTTLRARGWRRPGRRHRARPLATITAGVASSVRHPGRAPLRQPPEREREHERREEQRGAVTPDSTLWAVACHERSRRPRRCRPGSRAGRKPSSTGSYARRPGRRFRGGEPLRARAALPAGRGRGRATRSPVRFAPSLVVEPRARRAERAEVADVVVPRG
jgi:hypothetical protein